MGMKKRIKILAIDPSINNVGWAYCVCASKDDPDMLWRWGQINTTVPSYIGRCREIAINLEVEVGKPDILVMEWPAFHESAKGHIAAKRGYTIDLAGVCGYLAGWWKLNKVQTFLLTAVQWKGSVSKDITARKFFRRFKINPVKLSDHTVDAAMICDYAIRNRLDIEGFIENLNRKETRIQVIDSVLDSQPHTQSIEKL